MEALDIREVLMASSSVAFGLVLLVPERMGEVGNIARHFGALRIPLGWLTTLAGIISILVQMQNF